MPRGSKPGERRGGRQRGTPNKKTVLRNAAISAAAANPELTPLDFLRGVMRDQNASPDMRIKAAQAAAPYVHAKPLRGAHPGDPAEGATLLGETGAFTIDTAVAKTLRDDYERLSYLGRKQYTPRDYGGPLSAAEAVEESELRRSIAEKARAIGCPAGYGAREAHRDRNRVHARPLGGTAMPDQLSSLYSEFLEGGYDCVDRVVLNASFSMGQSGGGFRVWWRELYGSDENLDDNHLMRMAGRFSRRLRAWAKANGVPVVYCSPGWFGRRRRQEPANSASESPKILGPT